MIRRATIFCAAALLTTGGVATYATTPESFSDGMPQELAIAPYAGMSGSKQLLLFLGQAESLVYKGDSTFAKMHINEALSAAARLPSSSKADRREAQLHRVTLVTLRDGTITRELLVMQPENITAPLDFAPGILPGDRYKVTAAQVHYVNADWNKERILIALNHILRGIEKGKAVSSDFDELHELLLKDNEHTVSDRRAAQDNIALARALIRAKAYKPAKAAMARADEHIKQLADGKDAKRFEDIATIRNEIESVNATIERNEPAALKELDRKMAEWWNLLS